MSRTDVHHIIDGTTFISSSINDRPVATCYAVVNFGDLSLSHEFAGDNAVTVPRFIAALRSIATDLEVEFRRWDAERLRQAHEDHQDELADRANDPTDAPFMGDPEYRHAPTGDHILPTGGF